MGNLDSAKVTVGKIIGALAWIKAVSPNCTTNHYILHCHVFAEKNQFPLRMSLMK